MEAALPDWMKAWPVWAVLVFVLFRPTMLSVIEATKWLRSFGATREDERIKVQLTAQQQFEAARADLMTKLQSDLDKARSTMAGYEAELSKLRQARALLADTMVDIRLAATAARAMVHELERRSGEPQTIFPPLPTLDGL